MKTKKERALNLHRVQQKESENIFTNTIGIFRRPAYAKRLVSVAVLFWVIYSFMYGLWRIPVIDFGINRMTEVGLLDYAYLLSISLLTGGLFSLSRFERVQNMKSEYNIGKGAGFGAAVFAGVCPACQGIQVLALGSTIATLPLAFLVPYVGLIQIVTIFILGFALYLKADSIYMQTCIACGAGKIDLQKRNI